MNHTPGPWKPCRPFEGFDDDYWEPDEDDLKRNYVRIEARDSTIVTAHDCFEFDNQANAHLISAAPDLLRVAELIYAEWVKPIPDDVKVGELIARLSNYSDIARAAIKKAKGQ